ncbi:hypothetical protein GCM10008101_28380 [Lysobacter xinjiangensis]|uniref:Uncharacterized protein n=1 Tax=Cognatilysobacter xinjiangensis TaxID=546892 RepID=A0ABQ3C7K4_9GAMM|nr:hypothetical protein GCM10008101_28380 [Lysobacter xinjiangensis]
MKVPPLPIALLSVSQSVFGGFVALAFAYFLLTGGFQLGEELPGWVGPLGIVVGVACVVSAIQLWRCRWSGPFSFFALWLVPFVASLPFATPMEIIRDASFIEGRIAYLLVYGVIVFEFRSRFAVLGRYGKQHEAIEAKLAAARCSTSHRRACTLRLRPPTGADSVLNVPI